MRAVRRRLTAALVGIVLALAASACGGSSQSSTDIVARAAADTSRVPGYRMSGTITISSPVSGVTAMGLTGTFDRTHSRAKLSTLIQAGGHRVQTAELVSKLAVYMGASVLPGGTRLTGGKPWLKLDLSHSVGAAGVTSLPTASDPTQFVDYLRAVSSAAGSKHTQGVQGIPTAHYAATIDLDRYPALAPAAQRPAVQRSIATLESSLASHKLPIDVWIDSHGLVRQISVNFGECVSRTRFRFAMTLELYDFGAQSTPVIPDSKSVYDLTPLISKALRHAKLGCSAKPAG
jgi:hypothetical protein